jgi:DNA-directed RNA polymerase subunit E'/Rpb7
MAENKKITKMNKPGSVVPPSSKKIFGVYIRSILTQKVVLSITEVGRNIKQVLEKKIVAKNEGKCIAEGFIKPHSVHIISYSSGMVNLENVEFQAVFECMVCHPVEGMLIECTAKTITKAGIHADVITENEVVPITVFIARDHHYTDSYFSTIKENMKILIRVIGVRFELNDPYICVIGHLQRPQESDDRRQQNARQKAGLARLTFYEDDAPAGGLDYYGNISSDMEE